MHFNHNIMKNKIIEIISEILNSGEEKILPSQKIKDLNIDSLDMMEMIMRIEEINGTEVGIEEIMNLETIDDVIQLFEKESKEGAKGK